MFELRLALFENQYGPARNFVKAYVKEGRPYDANGQIRKKFAQRINVRPNSLSAMTHPLDPLADQRTVEDAPSLEEPETGSQTTTNLPAAPPNWDSGLFYR